MHIVFVTTNLATATNSSGGLASFTANMARVFAEYGHKVSIIVSATKEEKISFDEGIDVYATYIEKKKWRRMDEISKKISSVCREKQDEIRRTFMEIYKSKQVRNIINQINKTEKIDIVHYCYPGAFNLNAKRNIAYVVRISAFFNILNGGAAVRNGSIEYKDNPLSVRDKLDEYALKKAKYVISPSKLFSDICKMNLGINSTVIESPFVLREQECDYSVFDNLCQNKKYILHYGRLRYSKGTYVVAELVNELLKKYPDMYLVLAGNDEKMLDESGKEIEAPALVRKNAGQYANRVIYTGKLVREQLYPIIKNAEICLLPSRIENLSNACIEAMAMGKIVVATNGASYEQLIDDRVSGFLCERDNAGSFLKGIDEALALSNEDKEQMITKAKERIDELNPEKIYKEYLSYYEMVIKEW